MFLRVHVEGRYEQCGDTNRELMDIFSVVSLFFILIALGSWKSYFFPSRPLFRSQTTTRLGLALMCSCVFVVYLVLTKWSAMDVRQDTAEIGFYLVFSMGCIIFTQGAFAFLGVSLRDDIAERGNIGAGCTVIGLTIGATCCVAGANVGEGPGFEVVLFSAVLSTGTLLALWTVFALISNAAETITVERDLGAGIRIAGWLAGTGIVLGVCVTGDWISLVATLKDFSRYSWPVAVYASLYGYFERAIRTRMLARKPGLTTSVLTAIAMTVAGGLYAKWIGIH